MVILLQINKIAFEKSENLEENHISQNLVFLNFFLKWYLKILKKIEATALPNLYYISSTTKCQI